MPKFLLFLCFLVGNLKGFTQNIISIKLIEETRGFRNEILVSSKSLIINKNDSISKKKISSKSWKHLQNTAKTIDLEKLSSFVAPSKRRASDGALRAMLEIQTQEKVYQSAEFDHHSPPKELKTLIEEIRLNISKK
jgi:hypothetical protein